MTNLRGLILSDSLTASGVDLLKSLTGLVALSVGGTDSSNSGHDATADDFARLAADHPDLRYLAIHGLKIDDDGFAFLEKLPKLRGLEIHFADYLTEKGMTHFAGLTELTDLALFNCEKIADVGLEQLAGMKNLRRLDLDQSQFGDAGILALAPLTQLEKLTMYVNRGITDVGLAGLAAFPHLKEIYIMGDNEKLTDEGLAVFEKLPELTSVRIDDAQGLTDAGMIHFRPLKHLETFWLRDNRNLTAAALDALGNSSRLSDLWVNITVDSDEALRRFTRFPLLERLNIKGTPAITGALVPDLAKMTGLTRLEVTDADQLNDEAASAIFSLPNLKELSYGPATRLSKKILSALPNDSAIDWFTLFGCQNLTDDDIAPLKRLTRVTRFFLNDADKITDAGFAALTRLPKLLCLRIDSPLVTDRGLAALENNPTIELLYFRKTPVTDTGLASIATIPKLSLLQIFDASLLTDAGIATLELPYLYSLCLRNCPQLTDHSIEILAALPKLIRLELSNNSLITAKELAKLTRLHSLMALEMNITSDEEAQLVKTLPNCKILTYSTCPSDQSCQSCQSCQTRQQSVAEVKDLPIGSVALSFEIPQITNASDVPSANTSADGDKGGKIDDDKAAALKLSDFSGRWLILDFWATWCGPCIADMPRMKALYESRIKNNEKIALISIAADGPENADKVAQILEKQGVTWPVGLGKDGEGMLKDYGIGAFPTIIIINPEGKIAFVQSGANMTTLENQVEKILAPTSP